MFFKASESHITRNAIGINCKVKKTPPLKYCFMSEKKKLFNHVKKTAKCLS